MNITIRVADRSEAIEIGQLFYNTIRHINAKDYNQEQIEDWFSWYKDTNKWQERISKQYFIVAVYEDTIVGFSSLEKDGYLDFMFVHKDFQRKGIAHQLLQTIELKATEQNNELILSDVSITALPFFETHGYTVKKKELKKSRDKKLICYKVFKLIGDRIIQ